MATEQPNTAPPTRLGDYELLKELVGSGVASTWSARRADDPATPLSLVRLHKHVTRKPEVAGGFHAQALPASLLRHPNVIALTELGVADGEVFAVTEDHPGVLLSTLLATAGTDGLPVPVVLRVGLDILEALAAGQALRPEPLAHGELSSFRVVVGLDGVTRVGGFGVARALAALGPHGLKNQDRLAYAAPEQVKAMAAATATGNPPDARADLFSCGVILWELLAKKRLFSSKIEAAVIQKVLTSPVPAFAGQPGLAVPLAVEQAVMKALDRNPARRQGTTAELAAVLEAAGPASVAEVAAAVRSLAALDGPARANGEATAPSLAPAAAKPVEARAAAPLAAAAPVVGTAPIVAAAPIQLAPRKKTAMFPRVLPAPEPLGDAAPASSAAAAKAPPPAPSAPFAPAAKAAPPVPGAAPAPPPKPAPPTAPAAAAAGASTSVPVAPAASLAAQPAVAAGPPGGPAPRPRRPSTLIGMPAVRPLAAPAPPPPPDPPAPPVATFAAMTLDSKLPVAAVVDADATGVWPGKSRERGPDDEGPPSSALPISIEPESAPSATSSPALPAGKAAAGGARPGGDLGRYGLVRPAASSWDSEAEAAPSSERGRRRELASEPGRDGRTPIAQMTLATVAQPVQAPPVQAPSVQAPPVQAPPVQAPATASERGRSATALDGVGAGSVLGRYEILMPVAAGGMASVWAARIHGTRGFQKVVALKTMLPDVSDDPDFVTMFLDEARVAARIRHPNVVEILDLGEERDILYLVMEWVDGQTLSQLQKASKSRGGIPQRIALRVATQICAGLHAAHELRDDHGNLIDLVHRDVSPANVLVTIDGFVKVIDFGIAKSTARQHVTLQGGIVKGKTPYLSPEQLALRPVDRRSDIFSLGALLYVMTTGLHPFRGETDGKTIENIAMRAPASIRTLNPAIHASFEEVILRALEKDPQKRFATAAEMQRALEQAAALLDQPTTDDDVAAFVRENVGEALAERALQLKAALATHESGAGGAQEGDPQPATGDALITAEEPELLDEDIPILEGVPVEVADLPPALSEAEAAKLDPRLAPKGKVILGDGITPFPAAVAAEKAGLSVVAAPPRGAMGAAIPAAAPLATAIASAAEAAPPPISEPFDEDPGATARPAAPKRGRTLQLVVAAAVLGCGALALAALLGGGKEAPSNAGPPRASAPVATVPPPPAPSSVAVPASAEPAAEPPPVPVPTATSTGEPVTTATAATAPPSAAVVAPAPPQSPAAPGPPASRLQGASSSKAPGTSPPKTTTPLKPQKKYNPIGI